MIQKQEIINKLTSLREIDKFSQEDWEKRGLMPSTTEKCKIMNGILNKTIDVILLVIQQDKCELETIKQTIRTILFRQGEFDFDTEEKEFLCDRFDELASIVNVDIKNDLNKWLYGDLIGCLFQTVSWCKHIYSRFIR